MVNSSQLSPNVTSLDITIKTRAENLDQKNSCYSPHSHVSQHHVFSFFPVLAWMPMLLQTDCRHDSRESLHVPILARDVFVTILSAIPVVRAFYSASAELRLTVSCVRDHAVSVAFPHCTTPPLVLFCTLLAWPAQSLCVYTFMNFGGVTISIRYFALGTHFRYLTIRFKFISSLSVRQVIFRAVSLTLYMMSARS